MTAWTALRAESHPTMLHPVAASEGWRWSLLDRDRDALIVFSPNGDAAALLDPFHGSYTVVRPDGTRIEGESGDVTFAVLMVADLWDEEQRQAAESAPTDYEALCALAGPNPDLWHAKTADGGTVHPGDVLTDFRGETASFVRVEAAPVGGRAGRIEVAYDEGHHGWNYPSVWSVTLHPNVTR